MRVLSIFGTRPEAIKMAPLVKELSHREGFESLVCVTAQHREMLDQALALFSLRADFDLDLMRPGQSLSALQSAALTGLGPVLEAAKPELVLVHGDTTTTLAGALAAYYQRIPVGHVEAGLRTGDRYSPFPEEMNRRLTDALSELFFAPTPLSRDNLLREGHAPQRIFVTGNTAIDALRYTVRSDFTHPALETLQKGERLILLTAHRRESWGEPLRNIYKAVRDLTQRHRDLRFLCPLHRNPIVRQAAQEELGGLERVILTEPLDAFAFHNLMAHATLILTDSGGIQEEAPALGKPVLVLREVTERPEGVEAGVLRLVGTHTETIVRETELLLTDEEELRRMSSAKNPYGDGHASERICDAIETWAKEGKP